MKAISSKNGKPLQVGSFLKCADNSGAKILEIISIMGYKGIRKSRPKAGIGDLVTCRVASGNEKVRHQVYKVVIIRQRKEFRRPGGLRVEFEDNAGVIVNDRFEPTGTLIKGPMAKEAVERFKVVGKIASIVA